MEEKKYEVPGDSFSKSNKIISSKYKATLLEQKILNIVLAKIQQRKYIEKNGGGLVCEIKANELKSLIGVSGGGFYTQLKPVAASFASRSIGIIDDETETFKYISLISYAEYKDGTFTVKFNDELKQYISPNTQFTILDLQTLLKYKSIYSLRLHELLLSRCYRRKKDNKYSGGKHFKIEMDLNELKLCLGVVNAEASVVQRVLAGAKVPDYEKAVEKSSEKSFNVWYEFKRRVIEPSIKEINNNGKGIKVDYEPLRGGKGGKVYGINFYVDLDTEDSDPKTNNIEVSINEEKQFEVQFQTKSLIKENLSLKDIKAICETAEYDFNKIYNAYTVACSVSNIDNLVGFMIKAIKEGYSEPVKKNSNRFNNFSQREYDFAEYEKMLLTKANPQN